jgi:hypothetical protein
LKNRGERSLRYSKANTVLQAEDSCARAAVDKQAFKENMHLGLDEIGLYEVGLYAVLNQGGYNYPPWF